MANNWLNVLVAQSFGQPWFIWVLLVLIAGSCAYIILYNGQRRHYPFVRALSKRIAALDFIDVPPTEDEAQLELAARFGEVNQAMVEPDPNSQELRHAWTQFTETILDPSENILRATSRPEGYFLHLGDDTRVLAWWANIFVAVGLTFTFLGIVAALTTTVQALESSGGSGNITPALMNLLAITAVKFWTSIAGVFASIVLRFVDRRWHSKTQQMLETICDRLERGTLFSPPQRIAALQLKELEEQSTALKDFGTKLAIGIGDALEQKMQPMVSVLGDIRGSIEDFKSGSFNQIGKELGEALSRNAGEEMQQLAAALTTMTANISSITDKIEGSGQAANEQIAAAARDFSLASAEIKATFTALNDQINETGSKLTGEAETAAERTTQQFADQRAAYEALSERNSALLSSAADALEAATGKASTGLAQSIDAALERVAEQSGKVMDDAFGTFGERFGEATGELVQTLQSIVGRMEQLSSSIERSTSASNLHADKLIDAGNAADGIATTLSEASQEFRTASAPIREATAAVSSAIGSVREMLSAQEAMASRQAESMTSIAEKLGETADAASEAWSQYRDRFEGVDKALAEALDQIRGASSEHAQALNEQTGKVDKALADAIDRLAPALDPLSELADTIEDLVGRLKAAA